MITVLVLEAIVLEPIFHVKIDIMSVITLQTAILMKHAAALTSDAQRPGMKPTVEPGLSDKYK